MANVKESQLIEKYQLMLQKDPQSLVFAPLVDAYRKMGLLDQAAEEGLKGVRLHPQFASGRIALARVLMDRLQWEEAVEQLREAVKLSQENILAFSLLADCLVKLKRPKEALKAFKMVLFLNPEDTKASQSVKKLESLTADEFDDELFQMLPLKTVSEKEDLPLLEPLDSESPEAAHLAAVKQLDRTISLIDAFIVRNEFQKAKDLVNQSELYFSEDPEFIKRQKLLAQISEPEDRSPPAQPVSRSTMAREEKIRKLQTLLARISDRAEIFASH